MGDRSSDNLTRRMYREDKALWELGLESERVQTTGIEPMVTESALALPGQAQVGHGISNPPPALYPHQSTAALPDVNATRSRIARLAEESAALDDSVEAMTQDVEHMTALVLEQERQLQMLKESVREQQEQLSLKRMEQQNQHQTLADASHQLESEIQQLQRYEQARIRQLQVPPVPAQGHQPSQNHQQVSAQPDILMRHRERSGGGTPQARVTPLPEDYQPAGWCYQKLLQHEGIPQEYAQRQLEDFKMYWLSTGEARKAWDYRFVKHVIYQWQREKGQGEDRTVRRQPTTEELTDRSWVGKYDFDLDL